MHKHYTQLGEMTLVGLTIRTNNKNESSPDDSKIAGVASHYWGAQVANHIQHRSKPGVTYAFYTDYESDEHGDYTYFIGELVDSFDDQDLSQFETLTVAASDYQVLTTAKGVIPDIIISAWQEIWGMTAQDFGGKRQYVSDFEVYDERAADPSSAEVDIYIGIKS